MRAFLRSIIFLSIISVLLPSGVNAADKTGWLLSPGELSNKHAKYDGIGNCTLCHKVGGGLPDGKCLDCHKKLAERIARKEGVHARFTEKCIVCHVEHMGRDHSLINIKEKEFKHDLTGYPLTGKHAKLECRKCHTTQGVYTGLVRECISCHKENHNKQLGTDCLKCHEPEGWKEKIKFRHDTGSKFALKGAHAKLQCSKCHVNGKFKGLDFRSCGTANCHGDQHKGQFVGKECTDCHGNAMEKWELADNFNHSAASFQLKGKHLKVACSKCHINQRYKPLKHDTCGAAHCHGDRHKGQFGQKVCTECHSKSIESWSAKDIVEHWKADFRLRGRHDKIECSKCHVKGQFKPLEHSSCAVSNCHGDFHKGQTDGKPCTRCHSDDIISWKIRGIFKHSRFSDFELKGRHTKIACNKCHEKGHLKPIEHSSCGVSNCHGDRHRGQTNDRPCLDCHDTETYNWKIYKDFNHGAESDFALKGKHRELECSKCHSKGHLKPIEHKTCGESNCHSHDHRKNTENKTCVECHDRDSNSWNVSKTVFDHANEAKYTLTGKHSDLNCSQCHKSWAKPAKFKGCISCHEQKDPHEGRLGAKCDKCHTPEGWKKLNFDHDKDTPFPLIREHDIKQCLSCHFTRIFADTPKTCSGCHKKTGTKPGSGGYY